MNAIRLTWIVSLAKSRSMTVWVGDAARVAVYIAGVALGVSVLAACVSVSAPDKPIVIELNINVKQEVVYRLAADANKTIDENKQIF